MNSSSGKKPTWDDFFDTPSVFDKDFMTDRFDDLPQERLTDIQKLRAEITMPSDDDYDYKLHRC